MADRTYSPRLRTAIVLCGAGTAGAYQAGVYQGLDEAGIRPNWLAGISIGALNTAIIAGNAPEHRVEKLRDRKSTRLNSSHSGESRMPSSA